MSTTTLPTATPADPSTLDPEERLDRARLEALQLERLRWTVRHAYDNVPLYTRKLDEAGVAPDDIRSLDDVRLRQLTIGVQIIGNNASNTPPAHALARRGIAQNVRGFMVYGVYDRPDPGAAIIDAVADGELDVAIVWGPFAGYFAKRSAIPLRLQVVPERDGLDLPMAFSIPAGVRRDAQELRSDLDRALQNEHAAIGAILTDYGVPLLPLEAAAAMPAQ